MRSAACRRPFMYNNVGDRSGSGDTAAQLYFFRLFSFLCLFPSLFLLRLIMFPYILFRSPDIGLCPLCILPLPFNNWNRFLFVALHSANAAFQSLPPSSTLRDCLGDIVRPTPDSPYRCSQRAGPLISLAMGCRLGQGRTLRQ